MFVQFSTSRLTLEVPGISQPRIEVEEEIRKSKTSARNEKISSISRSRSFDCDSIKSISTNEIFREKFRKSKSVDDNFYVAAANNYDNIPSPVDSLKCEYIY